MSDSSRVESIVFAALKKKTAAERALYLEHACGGDDDLRRRVERLLEADLQAKDFRTEPIVDREGFDADRAAQDPGSVDSTRGDGIPCREDDEELLSFLAPSSRPDSLGRIGHYEVLEVLGKGAFGIVFRAFDDVLYRVVAIKVLAAQVAATALARKRFLREARSSAAVRHENVVLVHSVEETPVPYLVMEFIPGETLQRKLERVGALEVPEVVEIGRQIAEGLAAAHATGLIHRDIKPENVLLESGLPRVKITDFGLARAADDASLSQSGLIAGTPMYMAPEQALGQALDPRADLFSLGSVLYHLVAGRPPFAAKSTLAVLKHVAKDSPRPIRESMPETPQWLCDLIARLHAKNPDDRFQSAREVADLLARRSAELRHPDPSATAARVRSFEPRWLPPSPALGDPTARTGWRLDRRLGWAAAAALVLVFGGLALTEASGVTHFRGAVIRLLRRDPVTVTRNSRPVVRGSREAPPPRRGQETRAEQIANEARTGARALLERQLSAQPGDATAASALADLLLRDEEDRWTVLKPAEMKTATGAELELQEDGSIFVHQVQPARNDTYSLVFQPGSKGIAALRLEVLADSRLPQGGPGWGANGNFVLSELTLQAAPATGPGAPRSIALRDATADFSQLTTSRWDDVRGAVDGNGTTGWSIFPEVNKDHTAVFELAEDIGGGQAARLTVRLIHQFVGSAHNLGRFRLSVSGDPAALARERKRLAATRLTNPWARLAAAYDVIGKPEAAEPLVGQHPEAAESGMGDLYAAAHDWDVAITAYRKALTAQPADLSLLTRLATAYQAAGRTREAVPHLAAVSAANPKDTSLFQKVADLQAWFAQEKELAETCQRGLALAKDTTDVLVADRVAKSCSLRGSDDAQHESALVLAQRAVDLGKGHRSLPYFQMALGMAEYRSGHFLAADAALAAAIKLGTGNRWIAGTSAFYRAMSLLRLGKPDEARALAIAAAEKMKPLPADEQNPLAGGAIPDDLILWLAYKEAKAMIPFDAAPAAGAPRVPK